LGDEAGADLAEDLLCAWIELVCKSNVRLAV
jgi:hypothetical protein